LHNYSDLCETIWRFGKQFRALQNDSELYNTFQSIVNLFRAPIYYSVFVNHSELYEYIQNFVKLFRVFEGYYEL